MRQALAWAAALVGYPVGSWFTRLALTVVTLPLAGAVRDARSIGLLRAIRLVGGAASAAGGLALAVWASRRLGLDAPLSLPALVVVLVALTHAPGLRRIAGGPQLAEEVFAFVGEELGVLATTAWRLLS